MPECPEVLAADLERPWPWSLRHLSVTQGLDEGLLPMSGVISEDPLGKARRNRESRPRVTDSK